MSDEQMPAWADALEHRITGEISKAIADMRAEMNRRFDQIQDDLTINFARADVAIERVRRLEGDVRSELSTLDRRLRRLEQWQDNWREARS